MPTVPRVARLRLGSARQMPVCRQEAHLCQVRKTLLQAFNAAGRHRGHEVFGASYASPASLAGHSAHRGWAAASRLAPLLPSHENLDSEHFYLSID